MATTRIDEWEIRPGGMLVQKRDPSSDLNPSTIKVRVKYESRYHEIFISSQASFGELKKMLSECTGLHPLDQKLVYRKKERDSKTYLDACRVKNGSKIVLSVDIAGQEKRLLEMLKTSCIEKASKSLAEISPRVDKFAEEVTHLQSVASKGKKVMDTDLDNLIGKLMTELVRLDEISVEGDLKLKKREQEKRVQKHIEVLDMLKLSSSKQKNNGGKQHHSMPKSQRRLNLQHPLTKSGESVVCTTNWETFD